MRGKHAAKTAHRQATTLADELEAARAEVKALRAEAAQSKRAHAAELTELRRDFAATVAERVEQARTAEEDRKVADRVAIEMKTIWLERRNEVALIVGKWVRTYAVKATSDAWDALGESLGLGADYGTFVDAGRGRPREIRRLTPERSRSNKRMSRDYRGESV